MLSRWFYLLPRLILLLAAYPISAFAEDIPLDTCDRLPVIQVTLVGKSGSTKSGTTKSTLRFLIDTAATSMLNSRSFREGDPGSISVTSWSGTVETKSRQVTLHELIIGQHSLKDLRLPAVDLSVIGEACGKRIDGILGFDLLSQLGITVDLKNHTAQLLPDAKSMQAVIAELHDQLNGCEGAFNRGDETSFAECLDPTIVMFTVGGDFYGRDRVMEYYRKKYFQHEPPGHIAMTHRAHHLIGDAIWLEYDLKIILGEQIIQARGTALCRKSNGRWLIVHMNHSSPPATELKAQKDE
jgi:hypothetical protein